MARFHARRASTQDMAWVRHALAFVLALRACSAAGAGPAFAFPLLRLGSWPLSAQAALHMAPAAPAAAHARRPANGLAAKRDRAGDDGGMRDVLSDPEIVLALQNPKVMQAMMEMQMRGGAVTSKQADDPELMALLMKVQVGCIRRRH